MRHPKPSLFDRNINGRSIPGERVRCYVVAANVDITQAIQPTTPTGGKQETRMTSVHIVCIGSDILDGSVLDTNVQWICKRLTSMGGVVERAVLVRNDCASIVFEVRHGVLASVRLLVTIGGIGPAADNPTLIAIGRATNRSMVVSAEAMKMLEYKYAAYAQQGEVDISGMPSAKEALARLPEGGVPVSNPVGLAAGMILTIRCTTILSLPGRREELQELFNGPLHSSLSQIFGKEAACGERESRIRD